MFRRTKTSTCHVTNSLDTCMMKMGNYWVMNDALTVQVNVLNNSNKRVNLLLSVLIDYLLFTKIIM